MKQRKVLVTGGAGFIGRHLVRKLISNGYLVRIIDSLLPSVHGNLPDQTKWLQCQDIEFVHSNMLNRDLLNEALDDVEIVFHLAAETGTSQSMYKIYDYYSSNCQSTALLMDIIANERPKKLKRFVLTSSRSIYGEGSYRCSKCSLPRYTPQTRLKKDLLDKNWNFYCPQCSALLKAVPTKETDTIKPASIYASSKSAQEELVRITCSNYEIDYSILRLQNVYGEGQSLENPYTGILSIFSSLAREGQTIEVFEDGLETRDFVYISDVVNTLLRVASFDSQMMTEINVGKSEPVTILKLANLVNEAFGSKSEVSISGYFRAGDIRNNFADISRLKTILGIDPKVSIEEGLSRFTDWVKRQPKSISKLNFAKKELLSRGLLEHIGDK